MHKALNSDRQKADLKVVFLFVITGNLIGKLLKKNGEIRFSIRYFFSTSI
ncbi:hypothetical protein ACVNP0_05715 [Staphylococcus aureus]